MLDWLASDSQVVWRGTLGQVNSDIWLSICDKSSVVDVNELICISDISKFLVIKPKDRNIKFY